MTYTRSSRVCGGFVQAFRRAWPSFRAVSMFRCNMSTVDRWPSFAGISSQIPKVNTARCEGFIPHPLVRWAWSRRADSNRHPRFTTPVLCPLSYKGITAQPELHRSPWGRGRAFTGRPIYGREKREWK